MVKHFLAIFVAFVLTLLILSSCNLQVRNETPDDTKTETVHQTAEPENLIYNTTSDLYVVTEESFDLDLLIDFDMDLWDIRRKFIIYAGDDSELHKHEIVFGHTNRDVTKKALEILNKDLPERGDEAKYLIYSDGSSLAVVWDEDEDFLARDLALQYLLDNCVKEEFTAADGVVFEGSINLLEYYTAKDEKFMAEQWEAVEKELGRDITEALRDYYDMFSSDLVIWLAGLYDSDICVCKKLYGKEFCENTKYCGTGGFYYSNSARDTVGYLPDVESTIHALSLMKYIGLADRRGGSWTSVITEDMKEQIGAFVYALEEPNGYFYHPQWEAYWDKNAAAEGRFLNAAGEILQTLGITPKYTTALGMKGEDEAANPTSLTTPLSRRSIVGAVSCVIAAASYPSHLESVDTFLTYLNRLNINYNSYSVGNTLEAQAPQIKARDREIGTEDNPTPLQDILFKWLAEKQNKDTGAWDVRNQNSWFFDYYEITNGLMKIYRVYEACARPFPNADKAIQTAIDAVMNTEESDDFLCCVYNPWVIVGGLVKNVRLYAGNDSEAADGILESVLESAADATRITAEKIKPYLQDDGSGGMTPNGDAVEDVLNGCPAAVKGAREGELNGANIAIGATLDAMCKALGIDRPSMFGERDRYIFRKEVSK